jgi:hypothetical protein
VLLDGHPFLENQQFSSIQFPAICRPSPINFNRLHNPRKYFRISVEDEKPNVDVHVVKLQIYFLRIPQHIHKNIGQIITNTVPCQSVSDS